MSRIVLCVLLSVLIQSQTLSAQKFGKISKEELAMTSISEDPDADAVFLLEKSEIRITSNWDLNTHFHRRIKILTEQGKEYADIVIPHWHKDKISRLNANTILPGGKKIKVNKKQIFKKDIGNWNEIVFTFPGVEIGAVLEYEFDKFSSSIGQLDPWYFQNPEFTKVSHLEVYLPAGFRYNIFTNNPYGYDMQPQNDIVLSPNQVNSQVSLFTWHFDNIPALKDEPYMINEMDNKGRILFQIVSYKDRMGGLHEFYKEWKDIRERVFEIYGSHLVEGGKTKSLTLSLISDEMMISDKIKTLFEYARSQIVTDQYKGIYSDNLRYGNEILKIKKGSAVEKNLMLVAMLRHAGFDADPVLISTRDNGKVNRELPGFYQFNHCIVRVKLGSENILLDTGDTYCPYGYLPEEDLSNWGFCIQRKNDEFIPIPESGIVNMKYAKTDAKLNSSGKLSCKTVLRFDGYRAISQRHRINSMEDIDYVKTFLEDRFADVTLDSFEIVGLESVDSPLSVEMNYSVNGFGQSSGNMIYLNPNLFQYMESNPFTKETREFDVEFSYIRYVMEEVVIHLPEGFSIEEKPVPLHVQGPSASYRSVCNVDEEKRKLEYQKSFKINKVVYKPHEYKDLKSFFNQVVDANQSQLVLKNMQ